MTSAKVNVKEIDLSTRVPQFPGAFGGMVIQAKKGPVDQATLITSEAQFLKTFTPDERIEIGMDNAHFDALMFLEKSDKLWVSRAANGALFGGVVFRDGTTTGANAPLATGLAAPEDYVFDTGIDVPAVAQIVDAVVANTGTFYDVIGAAKALTMNDGANAAHDFWFNVTDGANSQTDPALGGTAHQVDILDADTANDIAGKLQAVVDGVGGFTATVATATVTTENDVAGIADAPVITGTAVSSATVTTLGADSISGVDEVMLITGWNAGDWNDDIAVVLTNYATDPTLVQEPDSFLIEVFRTSNLQTPVEQWNASRDPAAKTADGNTLFLDDVLESSEYIRGVSNPAIPVTALPQDQATPIVLGAGDDGIAVTDSEMIAAAQVFKNKDNLNMTILMDGGFATPAFGSELNLIAETRGDCVAILSCPFSDESSATYMTDIIDYRKTELNLNSSRAALYTPHVQVYDKFNDRNLFISPSGFAGGAISFSAANFEIWFPPAGARRGLVNALDLRRRFDTSERDLLQLNGINPFRFTPGKGIMVFGQKTMLGRPSALDRLNVRLMLIVVEPAVEIALEDFLFELNDTATRSLVKAIIDSFMDNILSRRGVTDFRTIVDATNNTDEDVDNNRLNVDLFVKPTRSVEEINLRVIITRTGVSFDTAATQV